MEYEQLPETVKKIIKKSASGEFTLPLNAEFTCKLAGILCLIPSVISILMVLVAGQNSSLFFIFSAIGFSFASFLLLGKRKRFVFDTAAKQLLIHTSTWSRQGKKQVIGNFSEVECVISRLENSGDFLVKLAGEQYHLKQRDDALTLVHFLSHKFCFKCFETLSDWPNKKPICETSVEHDVEQSAENIDLSSLGKTPPVIIKVWSMRALLKLSIPFWAFTLLAGLMQLWRQG